MTDSTASRPLRGQGQSDRHSRLARIAASLASAVVALGVLGLVAAPSASAADNGTWSVFPTTEQGAVPRTAFSYEVAAGAEVRDSVTIRNLGREILRMNVYPADAYNAAGGGGFALRQQDEENTDVGTWVKLARTTVTIAPGREVAIPFTMTVPKNSTPGDHAGGIVAINASTEGVQEQDGVVIGIQRAVGTRIYTRIQGPLSPSMNITDVSIDVTEKAQIPFLQQGKALITYRVVNTGNTRLSADQAVRITGLFGQTLAQPTLPRAPELLPGQEMTLVQQWDSVPAFNQANVRVELVAVDPQAGNAITAGDATTWLVPWFFLLGVAIVALLVWLAVRWSKSRTTAAPAASTLGVVGTPFPTLDGAAAPAASGRGRSGGSHRKD
jgi:hypothetical protein